MAVDLRGGDTRAMISLQNASPGSQLTLSGLDRVVNRQRLCDDLVGNAAEAQSGATFEVNPCIEAARAQTASGAAPEVASRVPRGRDTDAAQCASLRPVCALQHTECRSAKAHAICGRHLGLGQREVQRAQIRDSRAPHPDPPGSLEVEQDRLGVLVDQDVPRVQVAMSQPRSVQQRDLLTQGGQQASSFPRFTAQRLLQRHASHIREHQDFSAVLELGQRQGFGNIGAHRAQAGQCAPLAPCRALRQAAAPRRDEPLQTASGQEAFHDHFQACVRSQKRDPSPFVVGDVPGRWIAGQPLVDPLPQRCVASSPACDASHAATLRYSVRSLWT